jgi:hypothetical protein
VALLCRRLVGTSLELLLATTAVLKLEHQM